MYLECSEFEFGDKTKRLSSREKDSELLVAWKWGSLESFFMKFLPHGPPPNERTCSSCLNSEGRILRPRQLPSLFSSLSPPSLPSIATSEALSRVYLCTAHVVVVVVVVGPFDFPISHLPPIGGGTTKRRVERGTAAEV